MLNFVNLILLTAKMTDQEIDALVNEFWEDMEAEAAKLEVTVDYYVEEFMI